MLWQYLHSLSIQQKDKAIAQHATVEFGAGFRVSEVLLETEG